MVANTYTVHEVDLSDEDNFLASKDIISYAIERGWYDPDKDGPFDFAAVYSNPGSITHPSNIGRQRDGLKYVAPGPLPLGPSLPFSVAPRAKVDITYVMKILRHQPEVKQSLPAPSCAICSGGTQTSFVLQHRPDLPRDIGLVYWFCLASPDTSFFMPFYFGIPDFPAGFCTDPQRPSASTFNTRLNAPFQLDPMQAFWTFSNFRNKVHRAPHPPINQTQAVGNDLVTKAQCLQKPVEAAAARLYAENPSAARDLLTNFFDGMYLSALEGMDRVHSGLE
jgi:dipeptidase